MKKRISDETKDAIVAFLEENRLAKTSDVADKFGVSKSTVNKIQNALFGPYATRQVDETIKSKIVRIMSEEIKKPIDKRMDPKEIAEKYGYSTRYCAMIFREMFPGELTPRDQKYRFINAEKVGVFIEEELLLCIEEEAKRDDIAIGTKIRLIVEEFINSNITCDKKVLPFVKYKYRKLVRTYVKSRMQFPYQMYARLHREHVKVIEQISFYESGRNINRQRTIRNILRHHFNLEVEDNPIERIRANVHQTKYSLRHPKDATACAA